MKKKTSSLLLPSLGLFVLFAFSLPKEAKHDFLTILYPQARVGLAENMVIEGKIPVAVAIATAPVVLDSIFPPPFKERLDNFSSSGSGNTIDLSDPSVVDKKIEYDPNTNMYIITEKVGDNDFKAPTYMTFEEYAKWKADQQEQAYFDKLAGVSSGSNGKGVGLGVTDPIAKLDLKNSLIDRLFGGTTVDIRPQGNINLTFGVDYQKVQNPLIPLRAQNNGGPRFDFDMDINMSATGKIGEKLNLNFNYNTQATFDFDNQMKLNYDTKNFSEDEILQNIQAGDVSFPLKTTLIQGSQRLFGVKADMKFGHLRLSALASQQRSRQQNISVQGGSTLQTYEIPIDNYDENRHFFLSQYNRNVFEPSLKCMPNVQNLFTVTRMEVWITNDINRTENTRDVVAIADLGEPKPLLIQHQLMGGKTDIYDSILPYNGVNAIYGNLLGGIGQDSSFRFSNKIVNKLSSLDYGMKQIKDFEKVRGRLLSTSEYSFHDQLGFVSLNLNVQPDQTVGIAVEYMYNGVPFKIGEFSNDIDLGDTLNQNVLFLKMLKSSTANVNFPIWDLMMKNIYAVGAANVDPTEFKFDIVYDDPGKGQKRFFSQDTIPLALKSKPLLQVFRLDSLNLQGDPGPDGIFDFIPGLTVNLRSGRVMFPVLEPFGQYLENKFLEAGAVDCNYDYPQLYDSTLFRAREFQFLNRFTLRGSYKSSTSSKISLGAFNVPRGSVRVSAGRQLVEGIDYEVDYNLGQVNILNDAILQSGQAVNVSFEDNTLFGFQNRTMLGLRADYALNKDVNFGATFLNLFERPLTQKVNVGEDPINNKMFGLDMNLSKDAPWLTRLVDKIPFISTKAPSSIAVQAEVAALRPGHASAINQGGDKGGVVYVDDFEGTTASIPLSNPANSWILASTPQVHPQGLFSESQFIDSSLNSVNRAKMSWYLADPAAYDASDAGNPYASQIGYADLFPNRQLSPLEQSILRPFDVTIYPSERGPYNFDFPGGTEYSAGLTGAGKLKAPESRWGGLMRGLNGNDFEGANIEFIEFWVLNPYMNNPNGTGVSEEGTMYIDLGSVSEDIMRDSRQFFENSVPVTGSSGVASTAWGRVPAIAPVVNAFDNDPANRILQDVGLDGLSDVGENDYFKVYMDSINGSSFLSVNAKNEIVSDPAADNFRFYLDPSFPAGTGQLERYKNFNGPQGNSPVNNTTNLVPAATNFPDVEDLNRDNSLNETEAYFHYPIPMKRTQLGSGGFGLDLSDPQLVSLVTDTVSYTKTENGNVNRYVWYRFRVPLDNPYRQTVGGIQDFRSIRFIRTYFHGFTEPTTFRFATFELGRNQWRRYRQNTDICGDGSNASLEVNSVSIEANSARKPFNYVLPNGIQREQSVGAFPDVLQNEQSLSLRTCDLKKCASRAVFKPLNLDMRMFERLKMFVHAEGLEGDTTWKRGDVSLFVRLGSDFFGNYYEYELPLERSNPSAVLGLIPDGRDYRDSVWLASNNLDFPLSILIALKNKRNNDPLAPLGELYEDVNPDHPDHKIRIIGNPNLGLARGVMIGIRNTDAVPNPHCLEVWLNELRLTGFNERNGYAGLARVDMKLADFGNVSVATNYSSIGWGTIEQKLIQRSRDETIQLDVSANMELGKFFPEKLGLKVPFYTQYSNTVKNPEYDPYDLDIKLEDKLNEITDRAVKDSVRTAAQDVSTIRGFNFTNVRKERSQKRKTPPLPFDISNFSFTYSWTEQVKRNPLILNDELDTYKGAIDYRYPIKSKPIEPFKKLIKNDKYLKLIKEINFNPLPSNLGFTTNIERLSGVTTYRFAGEDPALNTFHNRRMTWDRNYDLNWDFTKNLKFNFDATAKSIIDEPQQYRADGVAVSKEERRDSIYDNLGRLGRPKNYQHSFGFNYTLPLKAIPFLDWVTARASYTGNYAWNATSLKLQNLDYAQYREVPTSRNLGNTIQNGSDRQLNGDFDFEKLYNKSKYLAAINKPMKKKSKGKKDNSDPSDPGGDSTDPKSDGKGRDKSDGGGDLSSPNPRDRKTKEERKREDIAKNDPKTKGGAGNDDKSKNPDLPAGTSSKDKKKKKKNNEPSMAERLALRPLMLLRKGRFSYAENYTTIVPGFVPESQLLGMASGFGAPGLAFISGMQPDRQWLDDAARNREITQRPELNQQVQQTYTQKIDLGLTVEPFREFRVELTANRQFSKNHSELFKDQNFLLDPSQVDFQHRGARDMGSLSVSYFTLNTLFNSDIDGLFDRFKANRTIVSQRLGTIAGNTIEHTEDGPGYTNGYGKVQTEVLTPAFLAAYTNASASSQQLDIFKTMPKPNWKLNYNGLSKLIGLDKIFTSIQISHGYKNTLTVNSYTTDLFFDEANPYSVDTINYNYIARYEIPQVVINEQLSPLLGIDMKMKNGMTVRLDLKKSRTLAMSFQDYQLAETQSSTYTFGFGYRMKNVNIPLLTGNKGKKKGGSDKKKKNILDTINPTGANRGGNSGANANDMTFKLDVEYRDDITQNHRLDQAEEAVPTRGQQSISINPSVDYAISNRLKLRLFTDFRKTVPKTSLSFPITTVNSGITLQFSLN